MQRRKVAGFGEEESKQRVEAHPEDVTAEMNLDIDISLKNDEGLTSILEVIAVIIRKLVRLGDKPVAALLDDLTFQVNQYLVSTLGQVLNLDLFAPTSIVYKLFEFLLRDPRLHLTGDNGSQIYQKFEGILALTFRLFEIYKANSKYFLITVHSSSNKAEEERTVRRMSVLFTDLLDLLVAFSC